MKATVLLFIIALTFFGCKRKQTLRELDGRQILAEGPITCYNGILDGDETSVDCGGSCVACKGVPVASCTPSLNTITKGATVYYTYASFSGSSNLTFTGSYSSGISYNLELGTSATSPNLTQTYNIITSSGTVPNGSASMYLTTTSFSFADYKVISGTVYLTKSGSNYIATLCGGVGKYNAGSTTYTMEAKISD